MAIYTSITDLIGGTPLLELKNFRLPGQVFLTGRSMKDAEEYGEDADE